MPTYTYYDAFLKLHITDDRETRAAADVATHGDFAPEWIAKLVVIRAYIITCMECHAQADDLFAQKLKVYRNEWDTVLSQARSAITDPVTGQKQAIFSISLERA